MIKETEAKRILGEDMISPGDLINITSIPFDVPQSCKEIPFSETELLDHKGRYYLIYGISCFKNGCPVTINSLKEMIGVNPEIQEPCFYNQDWYDKEAFAQIPMTEGWYFIRKNLFEESRAAQPDVFENKVNFPSAIRCTYSFFVVWNVRKKILWKEDFVWCSDRDHNGDRIYVGRYYDPDGVNKNGFNVHRHLALRNCYGCID